MKKLEGLLNLYVFPSRNKSFRRYRKNYEEIRGILLSWNFCNKPPLPAKEIDKILNSVYSTPYEDRKKRNENQEQPKVSKAEKQLQVFSLMSEKFKKMQIS